MTIDIMSTSSTDTSVSVTARAYAPGSDPVISVQFGIALYGTEDFQKIYTRNVNMSGYEDYSHTFTGLDPDTLYTVRVVCLHDSFTTHSDDANKRTDADAPPPPSPSRNLTVNSYDYDSVQLKATFDSSYYDIDRIVFRAYINGGATLVNTYSSNFSDTGSKTLYHTFDNLSPDTDYYFTATFEDANSSSSWSDTTSVRTKTVPAPFVSISLSSKSHIEVSLSSYFTSSFYYTDNVTFYVYSSSGGLLTSASKSFTREKTHSNSVTWGSLNPSTQYRFRARYDDADSGLSWYEDIYVTTDSPPPLADWSWSQTFSAGDEVTDLTASEWNSFTDHINQVRNYFGLSDYSFTLAHSGDDITAGIFNQAINAINALNPSISPPSIVSTGNTFYASYLTQLKNSINSTH